MIRIKIEIELFTIVKVKNYMLIFIRNFIYSFLTCLQRLIVRKIIPYTCQKINTGVLWILSVQSILATVI